MTGLVTLPQNMCNQETSEVKNEDRGPREDPLVIHCLCICGSGALLGGLLWISRSMEQKFLFVLYYPSFLLSMFILSCSGVLLLVRRDLSRRMVSAGMGSRQFCRGRGRGKAAMFLTEARQRQRARGRGEAD